jgi:TolB-like protein/DNA-binding winged helix-turn-helix (wHTH) protein
MNERFSRAGLIARVDLAHEPEFALGNVEVRPALCEVAGPGWSETLEPRVMQVLVALARANGGVVSRDELIEACWEGRVVGEDSLTRCIGRLRRLAETSNSAFTLDTVLRVGYRLKVAEAPAPTRFDPALAHEAVPPAGSTAVAPVEDSKPKRSARPIRLAFFVAVAAVLAAGLAVWWFWPRPAIEPDTSVAVLPFANMSGDPAKEYFSDGFSEELLNDLSNDPRLRVAARTSSFAFKGRSGDTKAIARALRVHAIVEGSVREAGNRVRITAQLIDADNGYNIWSARYDRDLSDILRVQDEVAGAIAVALTHKMLPGAMQAPQPRKIDPAVYRLYLEAQIQLDRASEDSRKKGFALLRQVTAREPNFAEGWAEFSRAAWVVGQVDALHKNSDEALAHEAAARTLVLDPRNIRARTMQAHLERDDWDWSAAAAHYRVLRAENPNNWRLLTHVADFYDAMGFANEALEIDRRAQTLDPVDFSKKQILDDLADAGRYREGIPVARLILAHRPDDPHPLEWLCQAYARTGQIRAARGVNEHLRRLKTDQLQSCQFEIDAAAGDASTARVILNTWIAEFPDKFPNEVQEASDIGNAYVELNDFDRANDWYERAYDLHEEDLLPEVFQTDRAKYRQTAGFKALSQRPGFKAWQTEHDQISAELAAHHGAP